jgi:biopolymer transport protein ExbB
MSAVIFPRLFGVLPQTLLSVKKLTFLLAFLGATLGLSAQNFQAVERSAQADLDNALERYAELQEQIRSEKIPLANELNELRAKVRELRREADSARRMRDNSSVDLDALEDRVTKRQELLDYIANLVTDFGERFERDIHLSEQGLYVEELERFNAAAAKTYEDETMAKTLRLGEQMFMLDVAVERFDTLLGGETFAGQAVGPQGEVVNGTFLALGPNYYFANESDSLAGLALKTGSLPPVVPVEDDSNSTLASTIKTGRGQLPMDATLGNALNLAAAEETLWEHINKGGIWIWPILGFAALSLLAALFKFFEIYGVRMPDPRELHAILKALNEGRPDEAKKLAQQVKGPARQMLVDAVEHSDESKELIEEIMYERMIAVQPKLERLLPFIAVTAATAPLMGLLGTVTGMINTFKLITVFGTGDAKQLSSGISEALITTEFGLIVAIPSLILHALLNRRCQMVMATMERMAVTFMNGLVRRK